MSQFSNSNTFVEFIFFFLVLWIFYFSSNSDKIVLKKIDLNKINILPPRTPHSCLPTVNILVIQRFYSNFVFSETILPKNKSVSWIHFCGPLRFIATLIFGVNFYSHLRMFPAFRIFPVECFPLCKHFHRKVGGLRAVLFNFFLFRTLCEFSKWLTLSKVSGDRNLSFDWLQTNAVSQKRD